MYVIPGKHGQGCIMQLDASRGSVAQAFRPGRLESNGLRAVNTRE